MYCIQNNGCLVVIWQTKVQQHILPRLSIVFKTISELIKKLFKKTQFNSQKYCVTNTVEAYFLSIMLKPQQK